MSNINVKDNYVKVDMNNVPVISGRKGRIVFDDECVVDSTLVDDKKDGLAPRFCEFYSSVLVTSHHQVFGVEESKEIKKIRPFLLASEVAGSSGGGRGRSNKAKKRDAEVVKSFTFSNPIPKPMGFNSSNQTYSFTQSQQSLAIITTSTTVPTNYATYFAFSALTESSSWATLFDQYRINYIELWIEPGASLAATNESGFSYSVIDYDDANALSVPNDYLEYTNCLTTPIMYSHYRKFCPHVAIATYNGAFTGYTNERSGWIDMNTLNVQHFGLKFGCTATGVVLSFQMQYRLHVEVRNVR